MKNIRNVFFMPRVKRQFEKAKAAHPELGNHINDLRGEIGYYLAAHKAAGIRFDSRHLEIIYSDGVTVVLRQTLGIWIITRIVLTLPVKEYRPVFGFKRVREGAREAVRRGAPDHTTDAAAGTRRPSRARVRLMPGQSTSRSANPSFFA